MRLRTINLHVAFLLLIGLIPIIIAIGFRPFTVGSDTVWYLKYYNQLLHYSVDIAGFDYLFTLLSKSTAFFNLPVEYFFTSLALVNAISLIFLSKNLSSYFENQMNFYRMLLLLFSFLFISPFFLASQVNILRQGTSAFMLFIYYLLLLRRAPAIVITLVALLAYGFHHTAIFYILFSPLIYFKYSLVVRSGLFMACFYGSGIGKYLIYHITPGVYNKIMNYGTFSGYNIGIRYKFLLFTFIMGFGFHLLGKYFLQGVGKNRFFSILKIYWILIFPFCILGFGAYSDRYLFPAWLFLSIVSTVFIGLVLEKLNLVIYWYYMYFLVLLFYFVLTVQGVF